MHPTTTGRYRVHDRRENPADVDAPTPVFVLVERPPEPVQPTDPVASTYTGSYAPSLIPH